MSYEDVLRRVAGRARLVAVSKAATLEQMRAVYAAGQRDFGENRADSLVEKAAAMPDDVRWHFIGNLQSNKLAALAKVGCIVHSFDRVDLARKWPRALPVLVQVDFTGRAERNGLPPGALPAVLATLREHEITVLGLSTLPPQGEDPRRVFRALRELRDAHGLAELSMGMSEDYERAIEEGATMVRVGRAIFG
jgi:hypothetical protein